MPVFLVLALLVASSLATAAESVPTKERLAVLDFLAVGVEPDTVSTTTRLVSSEIGKSGRYETVGRDDIAALVGLERFKQTLGCDHEGCLGDLNSIGRLLQARYVVSGSVGRMGMLYIVNTQLMDVTRMLVLARVSRRVESLDRLATEASGIARELLAEPATLQLYGQVAGARLFIDDAPVGTLPLQALPLQLTGKRRLRVESLDHLPWSVDAEFEAGRTTRVKLELERLDALEAASKSRKSWGFGLVASGVVAGAGALLAANEGAAAMASYDAMDPLLVGQADLDAAAGRVRGWYGGTWALAFVAAAAVGGGVWMLVTDPDGDRLRAHQGLAWSVTPAGVAVASRF